MSSALGRAWHVRRKKAYTTRSIILSAPSSYKSGFKFSVDHKRPPRWYQKSQDLIFNSTEIRNKPQQFSRTPLVHTPSSSCCQDPGGPFWYWRKAPRVLLLQGWTLCSTNGPLSLNLTHALRPERDGRVSRWPPVRRHQAASWVAGWGVLRGGGVSQFYRAIPKGPFPKLTLRSIYIPFMTFLSSSISLTGFIFPIWCEKTCFYTWKSMHKTLVFLTGSY